jgi:hypothetical protein
VDKGVMCRSLGRNDLDDATHRFPPSRPALF